MTLRSILRRPLTATLAGIAPLTVAVALFAQTPPAQPTGNPPSPEGPRSGPGVGAPLDGHSVPSNLAAPEIGAPPPNWTGAGVVFDTPNYNFGKVMSGAIVQHEYWFTNPGKDVLKIMAVKPGCGCTTAGAWDREVPPGGSGRIPISVNTGKFGGHITKAVSVTTNSPEFTNVVLHIEGDIWQPITVNPAAIALGALAGDALVNPHVTEGTITNNTDAPIEILGVNSNNAAIRAEVTPIEAGKTFKLKVTSLPPYAMGALNAVVAIQTNSPLMPMLQVNVSGWVQQPVQVVPARLALPPPSDRAVTRQLYVRNNTGKPMKILATTASDPALRITSSEQAANQGFILNIEVPANFQMQPAGCQITIKTDMKGSEQISVPVMVMPAAMSVPRVSDGVGQPVKPVIPGGQPQTPPPAGPGGH